MKTKHKIHKLINNVKSLEDNYRHFKMFVYGDDIYKKANESDKEEWDELFDRYKNLIKSYKEHANRCLEISKYLKKEGTINKTVKKIKYLQDYEPLDDLIKEFLQLQNIILMKLYYYCEKK